MRKAIVVKLDVNDLSGRNRAKSSEEALSELNQHLAEGWQVVNSCPMSGTSHKMHSVGIIILEKN
jgi:hypothetical protein